MAGENKATTVRINTNKMGLLGAVSYIIGNIVGSGLFITPTSILEKTNSVGLSLVVWAVAAVVSTLGAFCYVELGTSIRASGADFAYMSYVKWYPIAFSFMCVGCFVLYPATLAIQAETFSVYLIKGFRIKITSQIHEFLVRKLIGFILLWLLMAINFFSLKTIVARFQMVASLAKIAVTGIIIFTGLYFLIFRGETGNLHDPFKGSDFKIGTLCTALIAGLFSYDGWDVLNFGCEELENPKRTMPLAIITGMLLVAFIFISTNVAYFVVLDVQQVLSSAAVADTFAAARLGDFQYAVPFLVCILLIGSINTSLFCASRYLHAASRQGQLPTFLSCANEEHDSPRAAVFLSIMLSFALAFAGNLSNLISYVGFGQWLTRTCTMVALLYIRFTGKPVHPDALRTPIIMPIFFFLCCATLVVFSIVDDFHICILAVCVFSGAFIVYWLFIYKGFFRSIRIVEELLTKLNNCTTVYSQIIFNAMPDQCRENDDMIGGKPQTNDTSNENTKISTANKLKDMFGRRKIRSINHDGLKTVCHDDVISDNSK